MPFKKAVYTVIRFLFRPRQSIYQHLYFKGVIKVKPDKNHSFKIMHYGYMVENELFWSGLEGGWEKVSMRLWKKLCVSADVIIDVGANTGVYSLVAKSLNANADVHAFEPIKRNFDKLKHNVALNNYNVHCNQIALSDSTGTASVFEDKTNDVIYSVTVNKSLVTMTEKVVETKIEIERLDEYINRKNIKKIDLMKIDVETHEPEVLAGFGKYLNEFKPTLLIEILNNEVAEKIQAIVKDLDYLYFNIDEDSEIRQVENLTRSDYFNYLFCSKAIAEQLGLLSQK